MNILQRAQLALKIMGGQSPTETKQAKFPLTWPNFRIGQPQWQLIDLQAYINEGFNLNTRIYSAIMYKVRALRSTVLRAYTGDPDHPDLLDSTHPLAQLVSRPNPSMSWQTFQGLNTVYLNVAGNAYIWLQRPRGGGLPETMYSMRPDRVFIIPQPDRKSVLGYIYVPEGMSYRDGVPVVPQDMIHVKLPNPGDPLDGLGYGLSPISSAARSADVDNDVTHFLKLFFKGGSMVTGLLKFDIPLDDSIMARIKARWKEINGGYENWDIGVLDSGGSYQRVGLTFDEMGFETIDDRNESRITAPFGVPGILIGTRYGMQRATYSNIEQARRMCWEDTLVPENALFEDAYGYYLQTDDGGFVRFDYSKVAALKQDVAPMVAAAYQLWQMGTPANMATATVGLDMPDIPGGDIGYLPLSAVPVSVDRTPATTDVGTPEAEQQAEEQQGKAQAR